MPKGNNGTPATQFLTKADIPFTVHTYEYKHTDGAIGLHAAEAIQQPPHRVLKTLMADIGGKSVCAVVPSDSTVNMKKLAAFFKVKSAQMMAPHDAERITGYHVGGISPFGQRKKSPTVFAQQVIDEKTVFINAGKHGFLIEINPKQACEVLRASFADIID